MMKMSKKIIVTVNEGKVRGIKTTSCFSGAEFYSFYGVPYGQSTAGSGRFKDPVKVKPWENVFDATTEREGCSQFSPRRQKFLGSEDCLYNNIHTPKLPTKDVILKPVVFCIHPGGLVHGTPDPWCYGSPDFIMDKDIVYVCVAHRLHLLGFLNLGIKECSGNQGLKDIILSLKWIKENISTFGGDSENITLLGSSSGSILVHYLMLSPATRGLFHKAVVMAMHIFNTTLHLTEEHVRTAYETAHKVGYDCKDVKDKKRILSFYKKMNLENLFLLRWERIKPENFVNVFPASPFSPTLDFGENAVLPSSPRELMATMPRIPVIYGICDKEAAMAFASRHRKDTLENLNTAYLQNCWGWGREIDKKDVEIISQRIRLFYLNGESIEKASMNLKIDIVTDMAFSDVYETLIDLISADLPSSVFVYKFEFQGCFGSIMMSTLKNLLEEPLNGTCHADDFGYWAHSKEGQISGSQSLKKKSSEMVEIFTKLICQFARTGDPNYDDLSVAWRASTPENPCYLSINYPLEVIDGKLNGKRMEFWENLRKEFGKN